MRKDNEGCAPLSSSLRLCAFARGSSLNSSAGFTLVEMLVVIVIIGILTALITVAATAALETARRTQIKAELDNIANAFEQYKNQYGSYPPNTVAFGNPQLLDDALLRHIKKAFPRSKDDVSNLRRNISSAEAVVLWLGGFSPDPERPFSGAGGPTYPLDERSSVLEFTVARLSGPPGGPVDANGTPLPRLIPINVGQGAPFERQVILYQYTPPKLQQPYLYFDTSRFAPYRRQNPPEFPNWPVYPDTVNPLVRAYVRWRPNMPQSPENLDFVEPKKFQVVAAGTDDDWGAPIPDDGSIVFPDGPYAGLHSGHADNLVNFSQGTLEDSQP